MEEVDGILTYTLKTIGCEITSKICELSSQQLIHCVLKCLSLINPDDANIPDYSPKMAMSNRFKIAQQIAQILTDIGYQDEIECQSLLYPTEADTRKILIFCVEKLPREADVSEQISSLQEKIAEGSRAKEESIDDPDNSSQFDSNGIEVDGIRLPSAVDINNLPKETLKFYASHLAELNFEKLRETYRKPVQQPVEEIVAPRPVIDVDDDDDFGDPDLPVVEDEPEPVIPVKPEIAVKPKPKPVIAQKPVLKASLETDKAADEAAEKLKELQEDTKRKEVALQGKQRENLELSRDLKRMRALIENLKNTLPDKQKELDKMEKMQTLIDGSDSSALDKIKNGVDSQVEKLLKLAAQWEGHRKPLVDKIREKQAGDKGLGGGDREEIKMLKSQLKEMGQEAKMKEQIYSKLSEEYEKMSKDLNRSSYTRRITEIIGNIKKQKREIKKVLQDTKTIQKDINTLSGRLDRTFAVADELIFKDAEKDKNVAQSYKLLVAIHSDFSKIINSLEEAGNLRRQTRDLEDKLELEKGKSVEDKLKRLKADIAQMQKENRILEARLRDPTLERNRKH